MRQLVYDLPTRLFHWLFAGLFLTAFIIAKTIDDDSIIYSYHMIAGLTLSFLVVLRLLWGVVGTEHARFSGFALNPKDLLGYFKGILEGSKKKWAGHNPASSWAAIAMFVMILGLGFTGYNMVSGPNKEDFEDAHELLANGMIIFVILHVLGIILHTIRHKEMIALSMVDGKKADVAENEKINSAKPIIATIFLALALSFGIHLLKNFDTTTRTLTVFGTHLQLGENEEGEGAAGEGKEGANKEQDEKTNIKTTKRTIKFLK